MKKKYLFSILFIGAILIALLSFNVFTKESKKVNSTEGFAVVELFTSEGCSSCPAAEDVIAKLEAKKTENIYVLSYHVDYWDRLGWKDVFSNAQFTKRQKQYAQALSLKSIYTPQVVINGATEFVGSDESKLATTIEKALGQESSGLSIDATRHNNTISVTYDVASQNLILHIALVQPEATTQVKRGENGGRTLHHINIVRTLTSIEANGKGTQVLEVPNELTSAPLQLIAFTQLKGSLHILSAGKKIL